MKICFFMQRRFAYAAHAMAVVFNRNYGIKNFCGYVSTRTSYKFLLSQKEINYTKLILEEDVYAQYIQEKVDIKYLEFLRQEYGLPNLWPYVALDRILMYSQLIRAYPSDTPKYNHEELIRIFQATARNVITFLKQEQPKVIIFSVVANLSSLLLFKIARKMGIKTLVFNFSRIGSRWMISEYYDSGSYFDKTFLNIKTTGLDKTEEQKIKNFLEYFRHEQPYYGENSGAPEFFKRKAINKSEHFKFFLPVNAIRSLRWYLKDFIDYFKNEHKEDYSYIKPWYNFWDKLVSKFRIITYPTKLFDKTCDKTKDEDYVYFPLQAEPEGLPMLTAPFYNDQLWLIRQAARSLPLHFKLYVKEHPAMMALRPKWYYKELEKIPNVKLIHPAIAGTKLIENSKLVMTITGSTAVEGALLKKPVIVFGREYFNSLSSIKHCNCIVELPHLVKQQLDEFVYNEEELIVFLAAVFRESVEVDFLKIWEYEGEENMKQKIEAVVPLVELIIKNLN